ncbi:TrkH family potassium uptake protein [Endomicrobium proavitum]|uniref:Potassium uptake protein, TrkH family n=1 Tax=Endomicrobium proavitum TaxID=1408281 RepID=A0A0G3WI68_9BACT|nr:potassium transporter TrkG [Endomicrobium proavitum]AKL97580.1 Potassium uptake protein, TrkH family [Endomicrobium proavitum]
MNYSPTKILMLFFLGLIAAGAALLSLPAARTLESFSFINNLFTSVSAVCVTGLSVVDIGTYYTKFGQIVILLLMQLGGIGYMFVSTVITLLIGKMALKDRRIMQDMFDISSFAGLKKLLLKAIFFVLAIEFIGAIILTLFFLKDFSFLRASYYGVFHSVAAFCNAGFSLFPDSLSMFANAPVVLYVISALIILGGLGFFVIVDIYDTYKQKRLHLTTHTKTVLAVSAGVLAVSFVMFLFSWSAPDKGLFYFINNSFFQAVSSRTAGFYSLAIVDFNEFVETALIFIMSIGAAPGSTAGGIKVTTLALIFVFIRSVLRGDESYVLFKRRIPADIVKKAITIFIIFFALAALFSAALVLFESYLRPLDVIFETISAFATVGLSFGITEDLSLGGQIVAIIAMFVGRIGILTILMFMLSPSNKVKRIEYPEARILVG